MRFDPRLVGIADMLTVGNGVCGVLAVISFLTMRPVLFFGTFFILLGMIFDGSDGMAARRFGSKHDFGRHLDSMSDSITFCAAPAAMVGATFFVNRDGLTMSNVMVVVACSLIAGLGFTRLIRFTRQGFKLKHFKGLATPANTFFVIVMCHIFQLMGEYYVDVPAVPFLAVLMAAAVLQVASVEYPKVRGRLALAFASIMAAVIVMMGVQALVWNHWVAVFGIPFVVVILSLAFAVVAGYVLLSPLVLSLASRTSGDSPE